MFGQRTDGDHPGRDPLQHRELAQQPQGERQRRGGRLPAGVVEPDGPGRRSGGRVGADCSRVALLQWDCSKATLLQRRRRRRRRRARRRGAHGLCRQHRPQDPPVRQPLPGLDQRRRPPPPQLHPSQHRHRHRAPCAQRRSQDPGRRDRVLHREVDPDAADRRHRVRRVADQQQAVGVPAAQPVQPHVEQLHVVERGERADPVGEPRLQRGQPGPEPRDPLGAQHRVAALADEVGALPVVAAVDHRHELAGGDPPDAARRVVGVPGQPEPPHVHRHAERPRRQPGGRAHRRAAAVAGHRQRRPELVHRPVGPVGEPRPGHPAALPQQAGDLGVAPQGERRLGLGGVGEQVEQVPLRHQRDVLVRARQPAEVADLDGTGVELHGRAVEAALRQRGEARAEAELVEQGQGGGVHGVAAEVAQEVGVLLQHRDLDAGPRQQQAEHHAGGAAADDDAGRAGAIHHALNIAASVRRHQPLPAGDLLRAGAVNGLVTLRR